MSATSLNPILGYETVAIIVKEAYQKNKTFKEVGVEMGYFNEAEYEAWRQQAHDETE